MEISVLRPFDIWLCRIVHFLVHLKPLIFPTPVCQWSLYDKICNVKHPGASARNVRAVSILLWLRVHQKTY
jgi:hypothetical protein